MSLAFRFIPRRSSCFMRSRPVGRVDLFVVLKYDIERCRFSCVSFLFSGMRIRVFLWCSHRFSLHFRSGYVVLRGSKFGLGFCPFFFVLFKFRHRRMSLPYLRLRARGCTCCLLLNLSGFCLPLRRSVHPDLDRSSINCTQLLECELRHQRMS